ncbi:MAG: DUF1330 domain-containing protein [Chloroflexi bacterium]|nr:DUF1330 domain-containing protein [Chloroflexota bacterium]
MAAYVIAQMEVHDAVKYREYASRVGPTAAAFGGKMLAATDADVKEGEPAFRRTIVGEFPSMEDANAWYDSEAYREILPLRLEATTGTLLFVEGFSLPAVDEGSQG